MVNLYFDESGSINNKQQDKPYFVICMVRVIDREQLQKAFKRFIAKNITRLKELDAGKKDRYGNRVGGGKMFKNDVFRELKASQLDGPMKKAFVQYISK